MILWSIHAQYKMQIYEIVSGVQKESYLTFVCVVFF